MTAAGSESESLLIAIRQWLDSPFGLYFCGILPIALLLGTLISDRYYRQRRHGWPAPLIVGGYNYLAVAASLVLYQALNNLASSIALEGAGFLAYPLSVFLGLGLLVVLPFRAVLWSARREYELSDTEAWRYAWRMFVYGAIFTVLWGISVPHIN